MGASRHFAALSFAGLCAVSGCGNLIGLGGYSVADDSGDSGSGTGNLGGTNLGGANVGGRDGTGDAGRDIGDGGTGGVPDENAGAAGESGSTDSGGSSGAGAASGRGGNGGSGGSAASGGMSGGAGAGASAGSGGGPAVCPGGCDDSNDCTTDACKAGTCAHDPLAVGAACGTGRICDAQALCVRCRDTAPGTGQDVGCSPAAPVCLGTGLDAVCAGCSGASDCNDGNECTTDSCSGSKCVFATVAAGSPCATGVCNGTASAEKCVACADTAAGGTQDSGCTSAKPVCDASSSTCYECITAADCATDNVSCTVETCSNHVCVHTPSDALCPASGDVCKPNKCDASVAGGCKQVDISSPRTIIGLGSTQGNGGFEQTAGSGAASWTDIGTFTMIFNCNPSGNGCAGSNGKTVTQATGGSYLAWLGGTTSASTTGIEQLIVLPPGTVKIQVLADTNFQTKSTAVTNNDIFEVRLLDAAHVKVGPALYAASNLSAQTGTNRNWTVNGVGATVDVSAYVAAHPGADSYLTFWSSVDTSQQTDFFIDNVRLTATVCQ